MRAPCAAGSGRDASRPRVGGVIALAITLVASSSWAGTRCDADAPGPCDGSFDDETWVGLCDSTGQCSPRVSTAFVESALLWGRNLLWVRSLGPLAGILATCMAATGVASLWRRRKRLRDEAAFECPGPPERPAARVARWVIPPVVLGGAFLGVRRDVIAQDWRAHAMLDPPAFRSVDGAALQVSIWPDSPYLASDASRTVVVTSVNSADKSGDVIASYDAATCKPLW